MMSGGLHGGSGASPSACRLWEGGWRAESAALQIYDIFGFQVCEHVAEQAETGVSDRNEKGRAGYDRHPETRLTLVTDADPDGHQADECRVCRHHG